MDKRRYRRGTRLPCEPRPPLHTGRADHVRLPRDEVRQSVRRK